MSDRIPTEPTTPFADALREAIDARRMTLARLHQRLTDRGNAVSMATLSYWRSGARRPEGAQSLAALADIEDLLGLDSGTLLQRLGPTMRTGPLGSSVFPFDEDSLEQRVHDTFVAMGATYPDPTRELSIHSVTDVGADQRVLRRTTRLVVQGTAGMISAIPFVEITDETPSASPVFTALGGGRIATTHTDPSRTLHGFLFELDRPITSPEATVIEWSAEYPADFPKGDGTGHGISLQSRELLLWTRFHPDAIPTWIEEVEETPSGEVVTPRMLDGATSLHAIRRGFGPGSLGLQWGWEERD
ncbi:hypothetical protein [Microbacterium sp. H1-D42]|uniref:hypothetical protein n=1 Tax=Microbacterium sp. H1-D42 TaxID=2925844 RepID=UPI001F52E862|nr:hypothetical protein [Microbacterium sp. H1-D42]UNK70974.1 hypothetical protein MNR00_00590 [Microbacterium sp. H1-D42]